MIFRKSAFIFAVLFLGISFGFFFKELTQFNALVGNQASTPFEETELKQRNFNIKGSISITRPCYSLEYDCRTKNASCVYEFLTSENIYGKANRKGIQFKEDPLIPTIFCSNLEDFLKSGFDRGHLAPCANHKNSPEEMQDTFFLSNISPQNPQFNRGYWSKLEKHVRDLIMYYQSVEVFTGSLYLSEEDSDGKKWVKYQVIGENNVAVPTHFFKVLFVQSSTKVEPIAYIVPNEPIDSNTPLEQFETTVRKVEKCAGILFPSSN
jgi:endonuclease G